MEQIYSGAIEWTKRALTIGAMLIAGCAVSQLSCHSYDRLYNETIGPTIASIFQKQTNKAETIDSLIDREETEIDREETEIKYAVVHFN
jgi:hypothetical protein